MNAGSAVTCTMSQKKKVLFQQVKRQRGSGVGGPILAPALDESSTQAAVAEHRAPLCYLQQLS